jgi:hypothetical protein
MHPEIEKLIDLALADGQIKEKERNVILKKAAELGLDADEVEMTLDGKFHQLEANKPKQKEKVGNIKTCPACGFSIKTFELNCSNCDHEFVNSMANNNLKFFFKKFEEINNLANVKLQFGQAHIVQQNTIRSKDELIQNFPIPNNKEDLIEFLSYALSKARNYTYISYFGLMSGDLSGSWRIKSREIIEWSKTMAKNDNEFLYYINQKEKELKKIYQRRTITIIVTVLFVCACFLSPLLNRNRN